MSSIPDYRQEFYETCKIIADKLAELVFGHEKNAEKISQLEYKIAQLEKKVDELCTK